MKTIKDERGMVQALVFEVEMHAFGNGAIREVDVPIQALADCGGHVLDLIFRLGQNDFQPKPYPSVSVGDVIRLGTWRYRVEPVGFSEVL